MCERQHSENLNKYMLLETHVFNSVTRGKKFDIKKIVTYLDKKTFSQTVTCLNHSYALYFVCMCENVVITPAPGLMISF